jgi:hypothetical protein
VLRAMTAGGRAIAAQSRREAHQAIHVCSDPTIMMNRPQGSESDSIEIGPAKIRLVLRSGKERGRSWSFPPGTS